MSRKFRNRAGKLVAAAALAVVSIQASAQPVLEEVIVTAQKREQSLQDVPISVSAFSGAALQEAGIKVFHVVPTLDMALKAIDCGVDGLVVEGGEGGGFKNPSPVSTMVLLPLIRSRTEVPIIAAGGMCDGLSMAGAFAMGAEGVQMGTRMLSCSDSPVHNNWKQAVVAAKETDTVFLNQQSRPALRALRTERTEKLLPLGKFNAMEHLAGIPELYFGGEMEAAIPLSGQVVGRIDAVKSADEILQDTMSGFYSAVARLASTYTA